MDDMYSLAMQMVDIEKEVAWYTRNVYTGHTLTKLEKEWRLGVKARNGQGGGVVCWIYGPSATAVFVLFFHALRTKVGLAWKTDKYYKPPKENLTKQNSRVQSGTPPGGGSHVTKRAPKRRRDTIRKEAASAASIIKETRNEGSSNARL